MKLANKVKVKFEIKYFQRQQNWKSFFYFYRICRNKLYKLKSICCNNKKNVFQSVCRCYNNVRKERSTALNSIVLKVVKNSNVFSFQKIRMFNTKNWRQIWQFHYGNKKITINKYQFIEISENSWIMWIN